MDPQTLRGLLCILGGTIMHLYLGWFYLWGNISVYVTSYFHKYDSSVTLDDTSIVFVVQIIAQALCTPIAPIVLRFIPPWAACATGGVIAIGWVFLSSFTTSFPLFMILYGFWFGVGIGFSYMCPIIAGWEYFPTRKGLVSGLIVGGFGFGSFIFGFISLAIANPDNKKPDFQVDGGKIFAPDDPISENAPKMIRINCIIWAVLLLISLPLMRRKVLPQVEEMVVIDEGIQLLSSYSQTADDEGSSVDIKQSSILINKDPGFKEAFWRLKSLHIWAMMFLSSSFPYYLASNFKSFGSIDIPDDQFMTIVGAVASVLNGSSRLFWAYLLDLFGFKPVYLSLLSIEIIMAFTFDLIHKSKALYLLWVCISFACLGGHFSLFPTLSAKIFGPRAGGAVYSMLFSAFAWATIMNWVLSRQSSKGHIEYEVLFYILASAAVGAFVLAFLFTEKTIVKKDVIPKEIIDDFNLPTRFTITDE